MLKFKNVFLVVVLAFFGWALIPPPEKVREAVAPPSVSGTETAPAPTPSSGRRHVVRVGVKMFYMPGNKPFGVGQPLEGLEKVARRYEALHPDIDIEYTAIPGAREWLVTQVAGGIAPDIVDVNVEEIWGDTHKGWYIPLDEFLDKPSAYAQPGQPGSERWWDLMKYPAISRSTIAPDGKMYAIVYDLVETGIFYNKDIFDKVGVTPPANWSEFLAIQKKIKEAGYIPMLAPMMNIADWGTDLIFDQFYDGILPLLDLKPDPERLKEFRNGYLDWDEIAFLYGKGFFTRDDPRYVSLWRTLKEWRQYMSPDISDGGTDYNKLFLTGRGAMFWNGSWMVYQFQNDPTVDFAWDVFYLPPVDKAYNRFADGHEQVVIGGPGTQYIITHSAIRDTKSAATSEQLKRCVDFLQFLTTPESCATVVNEVPVFMPNIKGTEARPELKKFDEFLSRRSSISKWQFTFDHKFNEIMLRMLEGYLNGSLPEKEFLDWMEKNMDEAVETKIQRQKPDLSSLEQRWKELAPRRAAMEGLPDAAR